MQSSVRGWRSGGAPPRPPRPGPGEQEGWWAGPGCRVSADVPPARRQAGGWAGSTLGRTRGPRSHGPERKKPAQVPAVPARVGGTGGRRGGGRPVSLPSLGGPRGQGCEAETEGTYLGAEAEGRSQGLGLRKSVGGLGLGLGDWGQNPAGWPCRWDPHPPPRPGKGLLWADWKRQATQDPPPTRPTAPAGQSWLKMRKRRTLGGEGGACQGRGPLPRAAGSGGCLVMSWGRPTGCGETGGLGGGARLGGPARHLAVVSGR